MERMQHKRPRFLLFLFLLCVLCITWACSMFLGKEKNMLSQPERKKASDTLESIIRQGVMLRGYVARNDDEIIAMNEKALTLLRRAAELYAIYDTALKNQLGELGERRGKFLVKYFEYGKKLAHSIPLKSQIKIEEITDGGVA